MADLGFGVVEAFVSRFPTRFTNVGVAEQNMIGVATGLALTGSVVFAYSIANFPTLRCLEQIRNDAAYHEADVKIVAVGGGLAYGQLGFTHHATEDLAILRVIPNVIVAAPGDPYEASAITNAVARTSGPAYIRLGKAGEPNVHQAAVTLAPGTSIRMTEDCQITLLSTGGMLSTAMEVARQAKNENCRLGVISMPWVRPLDVETVLDAGRRSRLIVTLEEHSIVGGFGGAVSECLAEQSDVAPLLRIGLPSSFSWEVGDQRYLRKRAGLDAESVVARILRWIADH